jgi:adenylate kinase family enzyme
VERVVVIGCSAAGKSTVARDVGRLLDIEVIHLDKVLWKAGCRLSSPDEELEVVRSLLDRPRWIMDGNYTASLPMRLAAADTVVVVDFSRLRCLRWAIKRLLKYRGRTRPDMGEGCPEQLNFTFFRWIWNYPKQERPQLLKHLNERANHARVVFLRDPADVDQWLEEVRRAAAAGKEAVHADGTR